MNIVVIGLSITSSWGNGHATTYRALLRAMSERGHRVTFLERDVPWYALHRDLPNPQFCTTHLYGSIAELQRAHLEAVGAADAVIIGSYVPEGTLVADWVLDTARGVTAFYDIDTPVTLANLRSSGTDYLRLDQIPRYDIYFSFTGGPVLRVLEQDFGAPAARALYCSVDPLMYFPENIAARWDLGYMGTYSVDRQPALERLLFEPARAFRSGRFAVVGPQYPEAISWPQNVERIAHLAPQHHRYFYTAQRYTLNLTRADMIAAGHSPSVRLFEAAACATPVISDAWAGLESFFEPGREIIVAQEATEVIAELGRADEARARAIGGAARRRVLAHHTADHRAGELESYLAGVRLAHSA